VLIVLLAAGGWIFAIDRAVAGEPVYLLLFIGIGVAGILRAFVLAVRRGGSPSR
jgi:hypothetical protein